MQPLPDYFGHLLKFGTGAHCTVSVTVVQSFKNANFFVPDVMGKMWSGWGETVIDLTAAQTSRNCQRAEPQSLMVQLSNTQLLIMIAHYVQYDANLEKSQKQNALILHVQNTIYLA